VCRPDGCEEEERSEPTTEEYDRGGTLVGNRNRFKVDDPISRMLHFPFDVRVPSIVRETRGEDGALYYTDVYVYDNANRRSEHVFYDADGAARSRTLYFFDDKGRLTESVQYSYGALVEWHKHAYDERGNEAESVFYKEDGSVVEIRGKRGVHQSRFVNSYEFDARGNWVKRTCSQFVEKDGQFIPRPYGVIHRVITYYQ
jgi:hypothetical protein